MEKLVWHHLESDEVLAELKTNSKEGLTDGEAAERRNITGENKLPEPKKQSKIIRFFKQFHDVLIYVLLAAALITIILGHTVDTFVILLVIFINAGIGYIQQNKAEKALDSIRKMLSLKATAIRSSKRKVIPSTGLVPGDIAILKAGDKVPADIRLLEAANLKVEESSLTGESEAVIKTVEALPVETALGDRVNMAFAGTTVSAGTGIGVVVETGSRTELGKISSSIAHVEKLQTPLLKQTAHFGKLISVIIVTSAVVMFAIGYFWRDYPAGELLLAIIGLTVAAIPEGLPAVLSIILALGVQEMAKKNAIIRTLPSVETLGAVSVICSDKTGTLTKNEMTVTSILLKDEEFEVTGAGYSPDGAILSRESEAKLADSIHLKQFLTCIKTINESHLFCNDDGQWEISGDATEGCLVTVAEKADESITKLDCLSKIPFDSSYKYMAGLVEQDDAKIIFVKGAPEQIFRMAENDNAEEMAEWHEKISSHARLGERMIGAAAKTMPADTSVISHDDLEEGFEILGFAGIIDPPREEVIESIRDCKNAGIQVKMITGDHKETAIAIGAQMGIGSDGLVLEGVELDRMGEEELKEAAVKYDIFARTSPSNKLQLVEALQSLGHICAMTGDGVNDAPALKRADIGVAMGIKGTEVSKEASEMVLADDNFNTIVAAVKEGRRVYDNLKKTILFILPTNVAEGSVIFISILLGIAMPLTPVQILWVNMITAVTISLAIAFEKIEPGAMERPPRNPKAKLLSGYYIFRIAFVATIICSGILYMNRLLTEANFDAAIVNTMTVQALVISQLYYLFNCRSEKGFAFRKGFFSNKAAFIVSGILLVVQLGVTYLPFMNLLLGTVPIEAHHWIWPIAIGFSVFSIVEAEKWIWRKLSPSR